MLRFTGSLVVPLLAALLATVHASMAVAETQDAANVCTPQLSTVPDCVAVSPTGALAYTVTIICTAGPLNAARVEIRFNVPGDTLLCWCDSTPDPGGPPFTHSFFANTNPQGVATFNIRGGGCIQRGLAAIPGSNDYAGEIFVDNVKFAEFGTVSPDVVDAAGRLATSTPALWDPAGTCATGLGDGVQHTTPLATALYEWCTDINCDDVVGVADAVLLTPFLAGAASCPGNAGASP
jgi:hypothetical protein